ncbi:MAG: hypothetical protein LBK00_07205 [Treponema sp.]|nr:hypothetical protein [Treponema sp.]
MLLKQAGKKDRTRPTTHDPRPTTHDPRPTTHDPRPTTHDPRPTTQLYSIKKTACQVPDAANPST